MHRYAEGTEVPIAKSRAEVDALLRQWGAAGVSWGDDFESGMVTLRFAWKREGATYLARVLVNLEPMEKLREKARNKRSWRKEVCEGKLQKLVSARGRREHRLLLLWLKAAFNAVEASLVRAEEIFLPFLEGQDGRTVAEVAIPQLAALLTANTDRLLPTARGASHG